MTSMNTRLAFVACVALITTTAHAEPALAYPKGREQCARGYTQSGSFCTPKTGGTVRPAVPRRLVPVRVGRQRRRGEKMR
jgi:hypothetical protein